MKLSNYLEQSLIFFDLSAKTKEEIIDLLLVKIAESEPVILKNMSKLNDELKYSIDKAPSLSSGRLFLPHISSSNYSDILVAMGFLKKPIESNQGPISMVIIIISSNKHVKNMMSVLGSISCFFMDDKADKILSIAKKKNASLLIDFLDSNQKDSYLRASDIMTDLIPMKKSDSIQDLSSRFICENAFTLPVVDSKGKMIGEVRNLDLIKLGMPSGTSSLNNVSFLRGLEFGDYLSKSKKVKDILRKSVTVSPESSVIETAFLMIKKKVTRVYVVENEKYLGTISTEDIVKKTLHL